jgi:cytochrome c-type biogenesis protein CcmH
MRILTSRKDNPHPEERPLGASRRMRVARPTRRTHPSRLAALAPQDEGVVRGWNVKAIAAGFWLLLSLIAIPALAVQPDEMLKDPALETRARAISQGLRCLVCQNQSIDDSDASLAHNLRVLLRERLSAGDTDQQAVDYIVARYGNFVLLKPPFQWNTALLWLSPLILFLIAMAGFWRYLGRNSKVAPSAPLTPDEESQLARLTQDGA